MEFFTALLQIAFINLVLSGDNAIVIALSAKDLEKTMQKKVVWYGTLGAIVIRMIGTFAAVYLLKVPYLQAVGGVFLIWIAYSLLSKENDHEIKSGNTVWTAVKTVLVADAIMGIDNVLAIAGAANGDMWLIACGLVISVPIVVWGSSMFIKAINKFPVLTYAGSVILAYTAGEMIIKEKKLESLFYNSASRYAFLASLIVIVAAAGYFGSRQKKKVQES